MYAIKRRSPRVRGTIMKIACKKIYAKIPGPYSKDEKFWVRYTLWITEIIDHAKINDLNQKIRNLSAFKHFQVRRTDIVAHRGAGIQTKGIYWSWLDPRKIACKYQEPKSRDEKDKSLFWKLWKINKPNNQLTTDGHKGPIVKLHLQ